MVHCIHECDRKVFFRESDKILIIIMLSKCIVDTSEAS